MNNNEDFFDPTPEQLEETHNQSLDLVDDRKINLAEKNAKLDLIQMVRSRIAKIKAKDELREEAVKVLLTRLQSTPDEMTAGALIKLIEVLDKGKNDSLSNLLGFAKPNPSLSLNAPLGSQGQLPDPEKDITPDVSKREEIKVSKNVLGFLEKLEFLDKEGKLKEMIQKEEEG